MPLKKLLLFLSIHHPVTKTQITNIFVLIFVVVKIWKKKKLPGLMWFFFQIVTTKIIFFGLWILVSLMQQKRHCCFGDVFKINSKIWHFWVQLWLFWYVTVKTTSHSFVRVDKKNREIVRLEKNAILKRFWHLCVWSQ